MEDDLIERMKSLNDAYKETIGSCSFDVSSLEEDNKRLLLAL
jgi:hypothetical protein